MSGLLRELRANPRLARHALGVAQSFARNYGALQWGRLRHGHQPTVTIALVEHLGDIVAAEPVVRFARSQHPGATVRWVVRKPFAEVVHTFPSVDEVIVVRCLTEWLLLWSVLPEEIVWDLHISTRFCTQCHVPFTKSGPAAALGYENYFNFGNLLTVACISAGIPPLTEGPVLRPGPETIAKVDTLSLPAQFVAIHAKSNDLRRDWPLEKWQTLVTWLVDKVGVEVVEVGTRPHVLTGESAMTRSLCGQLSVTESAEVLRRASLFIGVDSGPAHLANAVGVPGVILLGHLAKFRRYTPYSGFYADGLGADLTHWNGPVAEIPVETVALLAATRLQTLLNPAPGTAEPLTGFTA